jgi:periplasmic divalent cation tolerance protein
MDYLVYCTFPDLESAKGCARTLVEERLAACCTALPQALSIYSWEGKVSEDSEVLLLIKTTAQRFPQTEAKILEIHPYDCPEIIATTIQRGYPGYIEWLRDAVKV